MLGRCEIGSVRVFSLKEGMMVEGLPGIIYFKEDVSCVPLYPLSKLSAWGSFKSSLGALLVALSSVWFLCHTRLTKRMLETLAVTQFWHDCIQSSSSCLQLCHIR